VNDISPEQLVTVAKIAVPMTPAKVRIRLFRELVLRLSSLWRDKTVPMDRLFE